MLSGITITCFSASYAVTLLLEITRLFFRAPARFILMIVMTAAGLVAHSIFLVNLARNELATGGNISPFSSWYDWCLIASWVLAVTVAPAFCFWFLPQPASKPAPAEAREPGRVARWYRSMLERALKMRLLFLGALFGLLVLSVLVFGQVKQRSLGPSG